jgi:hypothetical protein
VKSSISATPEETVVSTEFGPMIVRRLAGDPTVPEEQKAWTTTYSVTGRRVDGILVIQPCFDSPTSVEFELLPSALQIAHGPHWSHPHTVAQLTVNGIRLAGGFFSYVTADTNISHHYYFRRADPLSVGEAPEATQNRARAALAAVRDVHVNDRQRVHDHALAYAKAYQEKRLNEIDMHLKEIAEGRAELDEQERTQRQRRALLEEIDVLAAARRPAQP